MEWILPRAGCAFKFHDFLAHFTFENCLAYFRGKWQSLFVLAVFPPKFIYWIFPHNFHDRHYLSRHYLLYKHKISNIITFIKDLVAFPATIHFGGFPAHFRFDFWVLLSNFLTGDYLSMPNYFINIKHRVFQHAWKTCQFSLTFQFLNIHTHFSFRNCVACLRGVIANCFCFDIFFRPIKFTESSRPFFTIIHHLSRHYLAYNHNISKFIPFMKDLAVFSCPSPLWWFSPVLPSRSWQTHGTKTSFPSFPAQFSGDYSRMVQF